jgi:predicted dehydrogenase
MKTDRRAFLVASALPASMAFLPAASAAPRKTYRACVIGDTKNGHYGHNLHLVWNVRDDVDIVAVADPDEAGGLKRAREVDAEKTYADFNEMLEKELPDLVTIAPRSSGNHLKYFEAAARIGAHGIMEKPLATDLAEADAMVRLAEEKNLKWGIAFNFRATPQFEHARRMIVEEKIIGDILELRVRGKEDRRAGGEDLIVLGIHSFDMMIALAGMPDWCQSDIRMEGRPAVKSDVRLPGEDIGPVVGDSIQATFGFPNGIYGHFGSRNTKDGNGGRWGLDVYGTRGIVTIRPDRQPMIHLLRESSWAPGEKEARWEPLPDAPITETKNRHTERYAPIVHDIIAAIEEDRPPKVSLQDGRNATEMIHAVFASHAKGARVAIPLKERAHPLKSWK